MLECRTKTGKGWQQLCGEVVTHIEVAVINDVAYGIVSCDKHHNPSAMPIDNTSDAELRKLCRDAGVTPGF
jgi:hypothetical protein